MSIIIDTVATQDINYICLLRCSVGDLEGLVQLLVLVEAGSAPWESTAGRRAESSCKGSACRRQSHKEDTWDSGEGPAKFRQSEVRQRKSP